MTCQHCQGFGSCSHCRSVTPMLTFKDVLAASGAFIFFYLLTLLALI